jgi:hypothetical protein
MEGFTCRNMYIGHGSLSYLNGLVEPRTKEKEGTNRKIISV